jgi:acyl-CoA thioesterase
MGTFEQATTVTEDNGRLVARLDPDWCVWSPAGGYLISLALRAAALKTDFPVPLSLACHFLAAPKVGDVELTVSSLRKTRVAESLRVTLLQADKPMLEVMIWCGDAIDQGYEHRDATLPEVPARDTIEALAPPPGTPGFQTLWKQLEHRPCGPLHWQRKQPSEPRERDWIRVREFPREPDAFLDAGRYALVLDSFTWPAAAHAHVGDPRFIAPTLSFSVEFQQRTRSEWLLSDAYAPCATEGRILVHNRVWSPDGLLLATGNGTLICRPRPQPRS